MENSKRDEIKNQIAAIVSNVLDIELEEVTEEKELDGDLRIDSLALYEIVVDIEEFYNIRITNEEADDLKTVGEAVDFIEDKLKKT